MLTNQMQGQCSKGGLIPANGRLLLRSRAAFLLIVVFTVLTQFAMGLPGSCPSQHASDRPESKSNQISESTTGRLSVSQRLILQERTYILDDAPHPPFVSSARRLLVPPELNQAPEKWIADSLSWCDFIFQSFPPALREYPARRAALQRLDDILHIPSAPEDPAVLKFYRTRMDRAIASIESTRVTSGMRIWKLYNHGFFIRTRSVSISFDVVPGAPGTSFRISHNEILRLAQQSDVDFISHWHPDHANKEVAAAFLELHEPVIAPPGLWSDDPFFAHRLTYADRNPAHVMRLQIGNSHSEILVRTFPGHQGPSVVNDIYLVTTPEGYSVMHLGDQLSMPGDHSERALFADFSQKYRVDLLLPNCWNPHLLQTIRDVKPALVIPGHQDELAHKVPHREDYIQSYERLYGATAPYIVMTWGETYLYRRAPPMRDSAASTSPTAIPNPIQCRRSTPSRRSAAA